MRFSLRRFKATVFPKSAPLAALLAAAVLAGCSRSPPAPAEPEAASRPQTAYLAPPEVLSITRQAGGFVVEGLAPAGAKVRLATPSGAQAVATADPGGRWRLVLPPAPEGRILGLSEQVDGRRVQAQGYVVVTPQGPAAQLRAGSAALRLDPLAPPALGALDFDNSGAAVVSGLAPADSLVFLKLDNRQMGEGRTDAAGRYAIAISQAVPRGEHVLEVSGDNFVNRARVAIAPAQPLGSSPMRLQLTGGGPRIDWLTPGGGLQSTILLH
jgi:hypothetical protein